VRVYRLPTETVRLDRTGVSVYHDDVAEDHMLQHGWSKAHRPNLRQFKLMLASLDPLGLPICCQPVAGNRSDTPLDAPAYDAAVAALGTADTPVVGDSKMTDLPTRGCIVAGGICYLGAYRPLYATAEIAGWVETALARPAAWVRLETVETRTGAVQVEAVVDPVVDPVGGSWHGRSSPRS